MPRRKKLVIRGSNTAKAGFRNEDDIVKKFNNWETDKNSQRWLELMGYPLNEIERVKAVKLHGYKTDVQVQITVEMKEAIATENLSIKLVSNPQGFNQIDKRWIAKYVEMCNIPDDIEK
ncbi:MAG: type II restriction endonuclease, partial [Parcubacteria group bacterium]|nr:type II restriction endonuclease [Parcubacteria group bacterium]